MLSFNMGFLFAYLAVFLFHLYFQKYYQSKVKRSICLASILLCAIFTSLCSSQGLMTGVCILGLWVIHKRAAVIKSLGFYIVLAFVLTSFLLYFHLGDSGGSVIENIKNYPLDLIPFFFTLLGNYARSAVVGFFLFLFVISILVDFYFTNDDKDIFAIGIIVTFLLICVLTTVARVYFGPWQGTSSRYVAFSLPLILGCMLYVKDKETLYINRFKIFKKINFHLVTKLFAIILVAGFFVGLHKSNNFSATMLENQFYFRSFDTQPDQVLNKSFEVDSSVVRNAAALFKDKKLNIFSKPYDELYIIDTQNLLELDSVSQNYIFDRLELNDIEGDPYILVEGAAIDPDGKGTWDFVFLSLNGELFQTYYGIKNPVVRKLSKRSRFRRSGFTRAIPIRLLPTGDYPLDLVFVKDGKGYLRHTEIVLSIDKIHNIIKIIQSYNNFNSSTLS
jgi:hypothetical protein